VTHDQEEALVLSDRIAIMEEGRFAGLDTPTTLYQRPPTTFVAKFFANANLIPATATAADSGTASIQFRGSTFQAQTDLRGPVTLAVRPRSLRLEPVADGLALSGTVVESLLLGVDRQVKVEVPEAGAIAALVDARHQSELPPGAAVTLHVPADEITVLGR
jgi:putative spermidine/putrescine transport system ATP-binding protein